MFYGAAEAAPAIPAAESTLGSHPCVALSSAQVLPEWINRNLADNAFVANGDNPLNLVSHARGSLHSSTTLPTPVPFVGPEFTFSPSEAEPQVEAGRKFPLRFGKAGCNRVPIVADSSVRPIVLLALFS
jgi:hypothetical protein